MTMRLMQLGAVLLLLVAAASAPAAAQTLDEILTRGKVLIGVDTGTPPFGVTNKDQQPDGADIEAAKLGAADLGVPTEMVPLTGPTRVAALQTNKVDMVISIFGITPERAKAVAFSTPYGIGIRRNDPDLLRWVNIFVFFHKNNGDLTKIHEKWVGSPLPDLPTC
jgi:polar amino acid transport system substrate-binding protein